MRYDHVLRIHGVDPKPTELMRKQQVLRSALDRLGGSTCNKSLMDEVVVEIVDSDKHTARMSHTRLLGS